MVTMNAGEQFFFERTFQVQLRAILSYADLKSISANAQPFWFWVLVLGNTLDCISGLTDGMGYSPGSCAAYWCSEIVCPSVFLSLAAMNVIS